ncbi:MAG: hypothetical protein KGS00_07790 [Alphaproteobacteria bacterium]|nr:hypothetical protein [Alphaproteobacteria bacterium]
MFERRAGDRNAKRFWAWFSTRSQSLANGLEALCRGEADASQLIGELNERIRRFDPGLEADIMRTPDGYCQLLVSGPSHLSGVQLAEQAPKIRGWKVSLAEADNWPARIPFRRAPGASMDRLSSVEARHEAYVSLGV